MSVLVGIVSKNRSSILPKALNSALTQTYRPLEVSVFDDHSSDDTIMLKEKFPGVNWEFSESAKGYRFARNKFMAGTAADYFCSLDDDSWFLDPGTLENAIRYLDQHSDVAVIAFDILSADRPKGMPTSEPFEVANFIGCGHVVRIKAVREAGYYQPFPFFYGVEEIELSLKLTDLGYKTIYLPGEYVWHDKTMTARDHALQYRSVICNDLVFFYRRMPLVILVPGILYKISSHLAFSFRFRDRLHLTLWKEAVSKFLSMLFRGQIRRMPISVGAFKKHKKLLEQNRTL